MITIKTPQEIEIMAEGGEILAKIMKELEKKVRPGITTNELDRLAESLILKSGGKCSFKGYKDSDGYSAIPYPACLCTSINEEIVHAIPSERILKEGDIISLDLGIFYKGFHTDMAITVPVGKISFETQRLIRVTKKALELAIKKVKPGNTFGDISNTIQRYVESPARAELGHRGFNVIRDLCGHGIGKELHEDPQILNYGKRHTGEEIKEGMVFCIEPMVSMGDCRLDGKSRRASPLAGHIKRKKDGFGYQTADGSLSAHFEHTIAVTKDGCKVLTGLE
jgi:methionyl aminopeptidase